MSTLRASNIYDKDGTSNAVLYGVASPTGSMGFRNRILNGDMRIAQRGTAAVTATGTYPVDRFIIGFDTDGAFSAQQDTSAPAGFVNSVKWTTTTADSSLAAGQLTQFRQAIEGTNISDLAWGTADAKTVTLSFWVRSSLTGTFAGSLRNSDANRSYVFTYSISAANTWEQKTVTIAGDTSGTWLTTTGVGIYLTFSLGTGSTYQTTAGSWTAGNYWATSSATSVIGTLNATWYITGVQLEAGSVASPFERRDYGRELMMCQRYCQTLTNGEENHGFGMTNGSAFFFSFVSGPVTMRSTPTLSWSGTLNVSDYSSNFATINGVSSVAWSTNSNAFKVNYTLTASPSARTGGINPNGNRVIASSEL